MLEMRGNSTVMVQLGGLEPPTSCSTDRRSNQLSYNCILDRPRKGSPNGAETRCNAPLWQGFDEGQTQQDQQQDQPSSPRTQGTHNHRLSWLRRKLATAGGLISQR